MDGFALLLQANADIGTLWNIRREVVLVLSKLLEDGDDKGLVDEAVKQANVVERDALFRKEVIYIHSTTMTLPPSHSNKLSICLDCQSNRLT